MFCTLSHSCVLSQVAAPQGTETASTEAQRRFQPMRAPGNQLAEEEISWQLSKFSYQPEVYGIRWRSADLVRYVFQPWYQDLLDMADIQVSCFVTVPRTCMTCSK